VAAEWHGIETKILEGAKLKHTMQQHLMGEEATVGFNLTNRKLMYKGRLVLAWFSKWITKILAEFHSSKLGDTLDLLNL